MSFSYRTILQDLAEEVNLQQTMQDTPYTTNMTNQEKINMTYQCLLRAVRLKQRISTLIFAYFLGQLIEKKELSKRKIKQIVTEHYYVIAIRTFYIFEFNPQQIYVTKIMNIGNIRKLIQHEFKQLVIEI